MKREIFLNEVEQGKRDRKGRRLLEAAMEQPVAQEDEGKINTTHRLSVVLPAHNEEAAIAGTIRSVVNALDEWGLDFEVIVVNDGSKDRTQAIVEEIAVGDRRVRLLNHAVNQGYGAALVSGFEAVSGDKTLVFFMDSDGQFDIRDLERFFAHIEEYDAVLGYRIDRKS